MRPSGLLPPLRSDPDRHLLVRPRARIEGAVPVSGSRYATVLTFSAASPGWLAVAARGRSWRGGSSASGAGPAAAAGHRWSCAATATAIIPSRVDRRIKRRDVVADDARNRPPTTFGHARSNDTSRTKRL